MALVASCGVLRMARILSRPDRLAKMRFRRSLCLLQWRRMCVTVCRLAPQSQRGLVTFGTSSGEEEVVGPDLLGAELYQQRALPLCEALVKLEYLLGGRRCVSVCCSALGVFAPRLYPCAFRLCFTPSFSLSTLWYMLLRPFSLHPVASLAALSTASFPAMPTWAGIHRTVTDRPLSWSSWT